MTRRPYILESLAALYAKSKAGLTGLASRDFSVRFRELLSHAECMDGDRYSNALADLVAADGTALILQRNRRSHDIEKIKVPVHCEEALFARIGKTSPSAERNAWAAMMQAAAELPVPDEFAQTWRVFCMERSERMQHGDRWTPFRKEWRHRAASQLEVVSRLLAWSHPALLRTVSAQLTGNSKFFERSRSTLQTLLEGSTGGRIRTFEDLKISDNPRHVVFNGPVRIVGRDNSTDYTGCPGESSLSDEALSETLEINCSAPRCVTVENKTKFHELARLNCGDLFVFTSYPNQATVEFLRRLPADMPRFHFGDTDPWGYDVLRSLRVALPKMEIRPLHMQFRTAENGPALTERDHKKLVRLLTDPLLEDVRSELERMRLAQNKGDYEQETLLVEGAFPYRVEAGEETKVPPSPAQAVSTL